MNSHGKVLGLRPRLLTGTPEYASLEPPNTWAEEMRCISRPEVAQNVFGAKLIRVSIQGRPSNDTRNTQLWSLGV